MLSINYQSYSYETVSMPKKAKNTYMDIEISSDNTGSNKIFEVNAYISLIWGCRTKDSSALNCFVLCIGLLCFFELGCFGI